jgi:hypothetical protein
VYSFEGEVLSEEDDEYNSDSSLEEAHNHCKELHLKEHKIENQDWNDNFEINEEDDEVLSNNHQPENLSEFENSPQLDNIDGDDHNEGDYHQQLDYHKIL